MEWYTSVTAGHDTHGQSAVYSEDGKDIAIVYDGKAHGALIAAAPDMLTACRAFVEARRLWRSEGEDAIDSIAYLDMLDAIGFDAAIAKAEGR